MSKFTDRVVLILNILGAAGMLMAYLAPSVNPARMVLPALFGLAYPYLLMLHLAFLCYWLIRLKKEILISILVILLGWNHLNNLIPLNLRPSEIPVNSSQDKYLKALSYNVRGFNIYQWSREPEAKKEIFEFLESQEPQLVCFQEYFTSEKSGQTHAQISRQLDYLPFSAVYYTADPANRNGFGIATFSKHPILKKSRIPFNSSFNAAMYTDILFRSDTIRIFNIHLQSIRFQEDNYAFIDTARFKYSNEQISEIRAIGSRLKTAFTLRAEQAKVIASYIKDSPHPVVVMGDFNCEWDDETSPVRHLADSLGLHAFRPEAEGFDTFGNGGRRLDWILVSAELEFTSFRVLPEVLSDHAAVMAEIEYIEPPEDND